MVIYNDLMHGYLSEIDSDGHQSGRHLIAWIISFYIGNLNPSKLFLNFITTNVSLFVIFPEWEDARIVNFPFANLWKIMEYNWVISKEIVRGQEIK